MEAGDRILFANKAFSRLCGYSRPEEVIGQEASIIMAPGNHESLLEYARAALNREPSGEVCEFEGWGRDGFRIFLEASVASAEIGGKDCVVAILRDHTGRKQGESQRTAAVEPTLVS